VKETLAKELVQKILASVEEGADWAAVADRYRRIAILLACQVDELNEKFDRLDHAVGVTTS
jgi:hypothetical protein